MTQWSREYLYTGKERDKVKSRLEVCKTCKYSVYRVISERDLTDYTLKDIVQCDITKNTTTLKNWCPNYKSRY